MIEHLKALAVFAKTVECGSFRAAARVLALSPSVVSHHVAALERALAVTLLHRSTRRLALTPDGERLVEAAREMLASAARGLDEVSGQSRAPRGALRLTAPALLAETRFCRDLAAFVRALPQVRLTIGFSDQRRDLLRDGLDLALRIGRLDDSELRARRLTVMPRVLVASPQYLQAERAAAGPADLAGWRWIHLSALRPQATLIGPRKREHGLTYTPCVQVDSASAMRGMALAGLGVASLPEMLARRELASGRLVEVLPGWRPPTLGVFAVWPGGSQRPGLTLRFVEFIAPRLAALFAGDEG